VKKLGAEMILTVMIIPFVIWVTSSIFDLQASSSNYEQDMREVKEDVKFIREYLINKK
jgi:hypothetical protein